MCRVLIHAARCLLTSAECPLLCRLAEEPGIKAIMRQHRWSVGKLSEMPPEGKVGISPACILGVNINAGQEISLRLRTDDLKGMHGVLFLMGRLGYPSSHLCIFFGSLAPCRIGELTKSPHQCSSCCVLMQVFGDTIASVRPCFMSWRTCGTLSTTMPLRSSTPRCVGWGWTVMIVCLALALPII